MNCPVCDKNLKVITYKNQEIDLCLKCGGVWFDRGQLTKVVDSLLNKNEIDPKTVKEAYRKTIMSPDDFKRVVRKCPRCMADMKLFNYAYDSNIFLDKCLKCNGTWTDEGEMLAVAKYIKGNPNEDSYVKALMGECVKYHDSRNNRNKFIALALSLFYLGVGFIFGGLEGFLRILLFLIFPLFCIFFGETLGGITGVRFRGTFVTKSTPGGFIVFIGWILLFLPLIFGISSSIVTFRK